MRQKPTNGGPLASAIRARISRDGLSAYRVAKLSGAPVDSVLRFLNGSRGLTLDSADRVASALGIKVDLDPDWKADR